MPAGVAWPTYLKFTAAALITMFAGSQVVHLYYKPLKDLEIYMADERKHYENPKLLENVTPNTGTKNTS